MFFKTDDPLADFDRWDAEQAREFERLPICENCGERVTDDHFYMINDEVICPGCLESDYRCETEDFIE